MRIRKCSHVGGHKYAGNVMVYGKDQWHWQLGLNGIWRIKVKAKIYGNWYGISPKIGALFGYVP